MGIDCATFLIDKDNVVRRTRRKVKVAKHVAEAEKRSTPSALFFRTTSITFAVRRRS